MSKGRASGQKCNATFRRARFDRAATWLGGMVVGEGAPARNGPSKPVTKYLSNGATNPVHARYYCGGNNLPRAGAISFVGALTYPRPDAPKGKA